MTSTARQALRAAVTVCALSLLSAASLSVTPSCVAARDNVEASPKGSIGLGLVGAEIGLVLPAAFGLNDLWATITFPLVGAAGGAAAGYYLIDSGGSGEVGVAMMTVGMVLVIPALVLSVSLGRYDPESEDGSFRRQVLASMDDDQRARAQAGPGLVRVTERGVMWAPPVVQVGAAKREGRTDRRVQVAMLSGSF